MDGPLPPRLSGRHQKPLEFRKGASSWIGVTPNRGDIECIDEGVMSIGADWVVVTT